MLHDIRYAIRSLASARGFSAIAILTLACGIGATTAIFSVVDKALLQPLGYPDPDRLVQLVLNFRKEGGHTAYLSVPEFVSFRDQTEILQDVAAYDFAGPGFNLTSGDRPEQLKGIHVSENYFRLFGAPVLAGRTFSHEEDAPGAGRFVVLSEGLAQRQFGSAQEAIGKTISLGNEPYAITGVVAATFVSDPAADLWVPMQLKTEVIDQAHYIRVAGRLKAGVNLAGANQLLRRAEEEFRRKLPLFSKNAAFGAITLHESVVGNVRTALLVLMGAVAFLLLIACVNIANLLIVRGTARRREIAIRVALGASRGRIVRHLLIESLLLSLIGGGLGLALGQIGVRALLRLNPESIPRIASQGSTIDGRILLFSVVLSVATSIICGLLPAFSVSSMNLTDSIRESSAGAGSSRGQQRIRASLVVIEFTLALILLTGAALMMRTFTALRAIDPGFDARNVLTMRMALSGAQFENTATVTRVIREGERRLMTVPGIEAVSASEMLPLEGAFGSTFIIIGRALGDSPFHGQSGFWPVSPRFFESFRIPLLRGRFFTEQDNKDAPRVVIISQAFAKKYWPNGDPIGEHLDVDRNASPVFASPPREIIGVVGDVRDFRLNEEPRPIMFMAQAQINDALTALNNRLLPLTWIIRTSAQPYSLIEPVQRELRIASGGLAVGKIRSMETVTSESTARSDFNTALLAVFAAIAVMLAAIGIFGLMAHSVQQSFREIGIRMALGAAPGNVRKMILLRGLKLVAIGVVAGLGGALALGRVMSSLVFGVKPSDPRMLGSAVVTLSLVGLLAMYVPARRATRINPVEALRFE